MLTRDDIGDLFERWYKPIRQWLSHSNHEGLQRSTQTVDDLTQEVFVRLLKYKTAEDMPAVENIQGYLFRIAANVRNEWLERAVVRKAHAAGWLEQLAEEEESQPERAQEAEDVQDALKRCMQHLTERQRTVLMLHINDGLTYKQIASNQGLSYRMVLRELTRAYARLRELMPSEQGGRRTPIAPRVHELRQIERKRDPVQIARDLEFERQRALFAQRMEERKKNRVSRTRPGVITVRPDLTGPSLIDALEANGYGIKATAAKLGLNRTTLNRRVLIEIPDFKERRAKFLKQERREQVATVATEAVTAPAVEAEAAPVASPALALVEARASEMIAALEANSYIIRRAAKALGVEVTTLHFRLRKYVPDLAERRERWLSEQQRLQQPVAAPWRAWTAESLLTALESRKFSYEATAAALGVDCEALKKRARAMIQGLEERKATWLKKHRAEVRQRNLDAASARRRAATAARQAEAAGGHTCVVTCCGVPQHALFRALESTHYNLKDAARVLGITESKIRNIHLRLIPDFEERRQRARDALQVQQRAELIAVLEANDYSPIRTARALNRHETGMQEFLRAVLPDYATRRAEYLTAHSLGRHGGRKETEQEHEERVRRARETRSRAMAEANSARYAADREQREAAKVALLQELEARRVQMRMTHTLEKAASRKAQQELQRQYLKMRKRQVKELRQLNSKISGVRTSIAGYREVANLAEARKQREAAGYARKMEVLDSCGGDVHKAAEILLMHHTHVRKFKRVHWLPQREERHDDSENASAAG